MPIDRKSTFFYLFGTVALILSLSTIVFHIGFITIPFIAMATGIGLAFLPRGVGLKVFLFAIPLVNSLPALSFNGYPFNLMGTLLFLLAGLAAGAVLKGEAPGFQEMHWTGPYLFFLSLVWISVLFVLIRWSNITLPTGAFLADTPVGPGSPMSPRVSFAIIFPVFTLLLFSLAPFSAALIKRNKMTGEIAFRYITAGYAGSVLIAFIQKFIDNGFLSMSWWGERMGQFNGGSSDFNGFGFFGGVVFLAAALKMMKGEDKLFYSIALAVSFTGILLSGSRTAFIFIIFSFIFLLISKVSLKNRIVFTFIVILLLSLFGGNLIERLEKSIDIRNQKEENLIATLDKLSNGRIQMIMESVPMVAKYPVSGIGGGNFLFYLKYRNYGERFLEDLPLNQYLLFLDELGFIGLGAFLFFLWVLLRKRERDLYLYILIVMLLVMVVGNSLWLPEIIVLFFVLTALLAGPGEKPGTGKQRLTALLLAILFIIFNIVSFSSLHPSKLMAHRGLPYNFGFWNESADAGFRWTRKEAGVLLTFDEKGEYGPVKFFSGAPIGHLPSRAQSLKVFVNGKLQGSKEFRTNGEYKTVLKGDPGRPFMLKIEVAPVFNLKKMGLGPESRNLGIQFFSVPEGP